MPESLISGILKNDAGSISKAITQIENNQTIPYSFFEELFENSSQS